MEHNTLSTRAWTESYPLVNVRKPAPTVAGNRRGDAESGPTGSFTVLTKSPGCRLSSSAVRAVNSYTQRHLGALAVDTTSVAVEDNKHKYSVVMFVCVILVLTCIVRFRT